MAALQPLLIKYHAMKIATAKRDGSAAHRKVYCPLARKRAFLRSNSVSPGRRQQVTSAASQGLSSIAKP